MAALEHGLVRRMAQGYSQALATLILMCNHSAGASQSISFLDTVLSSPMGQTDRGVSAAPNSLGFYAI